MKKSKNFLCGYIVSAAHYKGVKYITEHTDPSDLEHFDITVAVPMKYLMYNDSDIINFDSRYFTKVRSMCLEELNYLFDDYFVTFTQTQMPSAVLKLSFELVY